MRKNLALIGVMTLAVVSAACGPAESIFPLSTRDDSTFDERLLGEWTMQEGPDPKPTEESGPMVFRRGWEASTSYDVTAMHFDDQNYNLVTSGRLVRLGDYLFIDFESPYAGSRNITEVPFPTIRSHIFGRIRIEKDRVRLDFLNDEWVAKQIGAGTLPLAYTQTPDGPVLASPTEELRRFALEHAEDKEAFSETWNLTRPN